MRTVFVKTNCQFAEEYCVETRIEKDAGGYIVRKNALFSQGAAHVRDMAESAKELPGILDKLSICDCRMEGDTAVFPYVKGRSFYTYIIEESRQNRGVQAWERFLALLDPAQDAVLPFRSTDGFEGMFGSGAAFEGEPAYRCCAFDLSPSNVLICDDGSSVLIDYEWRTAFPLPIALVKYHAVRTAYNTYQEMRTFGPPVEEVLPLIGMTAPEGCYQQAMDHFFLAIFGELRDRPTYGKTVRERYQRPLQDSLSFMLQNKEGRITFLELQNQQMQRYWKRDVAQWQKDNEQWKADTASWQEQMRGYEGRIAYLESQNQAMEEQWKADAAQWEQCSEQWKKDVAQWQKDNEQWKADTTSWQEQMRGYEGRIAYLESQNRAMEEQWKADAAQWEQCGEQWERDVAQWESEKVQWQSERTQWLEETDRLSDKLAEREQAYNEIVHSRLWRLAEPFRWLFGRIRGTYMRSS